LALPPISEDLARLIKRHIHSVLQLEVLLLLRADPKDWTPVEVAQELRITEESAELRLRDLQLRQLLAQGSQPDSYRYEPGSPELTSTVDELAQCYADAKHAIIGLIFSEPGDSARTLADAFRIRKRRDD
jgi:hypothetical protein